MLFVYHDNCNASYVSELILATARGGNQTVGQGFANNSKYWHRIPDHPRVEHAFFIILLCILRFAAFLANLLAMIVFIINRSLPIRRILMTLSGAEVLLCSSSFLRNLLELITTGGAGVTGSRSLLQFYDVVCVLSYTALLCRNWLIVMVSATKCDALLRPLQWRQGRLWHQRNELLLFAAIGLSSLSIVIFYDFLTVPHYCSQDGRLLILYMPLGENVLATTSDAFFIVQSAIPVFTILVLCIVILVTLQVRRIHLTTDSLTNTDSRTQLALSRHTDQATVLSLALALTFIPLEMPAFFANYLENRLTGHLSNVCVAVDSLANFFLYCCLNRHFRDRCRRLFSARGGRWGSGGGEARGNGLYLRTGMDISSNPPATMRLTSQLSSPTPGSVIHQHRLSAHSANNLFFVAKGSGSGSGRLQHTRLSVPNQCTHN